MNETFNVASLINCNHLRIGFDTLYKPNPVWRQNLLGCKVLSIIRDVYRFNITYKLYTNSSWYPEDYKQQLFKEKSTDFYATPMALTTKILDYAYPIQPIIQRRFGFVLRSSQTSMFKSFYLEPFTKPVWNILGALAILVVLLFYLLRWWEQRLIERKGECSISHEFLVVCGGLCQHILPIRPILTSRRIAYFTFLMSSYIIYSFYTSNLLSHLVSDRDKTMTLEELVDSDYELVVLEHTQLEFEKDSQCRNMAILTKKLTNIKFVNITAGLEAVRSGTGAIFSDFVTLYPHMRRAFDVQLVCGLEEIVVFSDIKLYFFTRKDFVHKEFAKIVSIRARETGILNQLMQDVAYTAPRCSLAFPPHTHYTYFLHIVYPLSLLLLSYVLAVLIMMAERVHYQRNRLWPYVN